ncbi:MAG: EAL domain-containing protein, partial [Pseudomonadota bacterium]
MSPSALSSEASPKAEAEPEVRLPHLPPGDKTWAPSTALLCAALLCALTGLALQLAASTLVAETAATTRLVDGLTQFEPANYRDAPAIYERDARYLIPLLIADRVDAGATPLGEDVERFRSLLEEGLSVAYSKLRDSREASLLPALRGARDQLLRSVTGTERRHFLLMVGSSGALILTLVVLAYGAFRHVIAPSAGTAKYWQSNDLDELLFEHAPVAIVYSDARDVVQRVNGAFQRLTGLSPRETIGQQLLRGLAEAEQDGSADSIRDALRQDGYWHGDLWIRQKNGQPVSSKVQRIAVADNDRAVTGYLTISSETLLVDEQQKLMLWQAHHDPLTKLPNRLTLEDRFRRAAATADDEGLFMTIDIDRFKTVNDSVGAQEADRVLADAALRIALCSDDGDTVARIGGDTFAFISQQGDPMSRAHAIWQAVEQSFKAPFVVAGRQLFLTLSAGVALFPRDGRQLVDILQKADAARNDVKSRGGDGLGFFEPELNQRAQRRFELQTGLRSALENNELTLALQPIVRIGSGDYLGAEGLLRWTHPELGFVSPGEFIPIAEETGAIETIGLWVMTEAGRLLAAMADVGAPRLRLSINVSPVQLRSHEACERLLEAVKQAPTDRLTLEITESALIEHSENAKWFLEAARRLGCQVALDDFGTG